MNANCSNLRAKAITCIATVAACAVIFAPVQAKSAEVTVKVPVTSAGLDLSRPAGVQELYRRLKKAGKIACGHGYRVDLVPLNDVAGCDEKVIGDAVRSANLPQLTALYLKARALQDAKAHGVDVPELVAAK
jgi:UrcA family protein